MAISTIGTDALASAAVTSAKLASSGLNASALTTGTLPKAQLPTGSVLQVVYATQVLSGSTSSTSLVDTGLTASITPTAATSKVLVFINHPNFDKSNNTGWILGINRGAVQIGTLNPYMFYTASAGRTTSYAVQYVLDSPATTSSTTYTTQYGVYSAGTVTMSGTGSILLMEIAA